MKLIFAIKVIVYCQQKLFNIIGSLPFHRVMDRATDNSITSSNTKILKEIFPENDPASKVLINNGLYFRHLNINNILTETKFGNTVNNDEVKIDGYNLIRSDGNRKEGGVACYIKIIISFNHHGSLSKNFANILIDILLPKFKSIMLDIIYRSPNQSSFTDDGFHCIEKISSSS